MNAPLIITLALIFVALPIVAGIGSDLYKRRLRFQERQMELTSARAAEKAEQYAAQVERLEQRMRVLERIATDRGANLAAEINALPEAPTRVQ